LFVFRCTEPATVLTSIQFRTVCFGLARSPGDRKLCEPSPIPLSLANTPRSARAPRVRSTLTCIGIAYQSEASLQVSAESASPARARLLLYRLAHATSINCPQQILLRVPSSAHLRVNQNMDVRFALDECAVKKAIVVRVNPPPAAGKP
jgi:hypothetical protein